ncbi:MAG: AtpZ/AtpI family protein [Planctomycetes bacterium]|nr:AtpZ/AtpI family protein [Planctomycetota bacterium]
MNDKPTPRELGYYASLAQVGMEMALPVVLGYWADEWLGTTPWLTVVAAILGFVGGLVHLIALVQEKARQDSSDKKPPP